MIGNLNSNNIENDVFNQKNEDSDYKNLSTKLKAIKDDNNDDEKTVKN